MTEPTNSASLQPSDEARLADLYKQMDQGRYRGWGETEQALWLFRRAIDARDASLAVANEDIATLRWNLELASECEAIDRAKLQTAKAELDAARAEIATWRKAEHDLSEAYLRLRSLILNAYNTPHAPSHEAVWQHTENCLKTELARTAAPSGDLRAGLMEEIRLGIAAQFDEARIQSEEVIEQHDIVQSIEEQLRDSGFLDRLDAGDLRAENERLIAAIGDAARFVSEEAACASNAVWRRRLEKTARDIRALASPQPAAPTDDELAALIKPVWIATKPSHEAQRIRSAISCSFDDARFPEWVSNFIPDYVWDLIDIAAQRGIDTSAQPDAGERGEVRHVTTDEARILKKALLASSRLVHEGELAPSPSPEAAPPSGDAMEEARKIMDDYYASLQQGRSGNAQLLREHIVAALTRRDRAAAEKMREAGKQAIKQLAAPTAQHEDMRLSAWKTLDALPLPPDAGA